MGLWNRVRRWCASGVLAAATCLAPQAVAAPTLEQRVTSQAVPDEQPSPSPFRDYLPFFAGTGLALAVLGAGHAISRARGKKPSFLQPAVEHPFVTCITTTLSYLVPAEVLPGSAVISPLIGGLVSFFAAYALGHVKPPYVPNIAKFFVYGLGEACATDPKKKHRYLLQMRDLCSPGVVSSIDATLIDNLFQQDKGEEALDLLKRLVLDPAQNKRSIESMLVSPDAYNLAGFFVKSQPFSVMYTHLFQGKVAQALKDLDGFVQQELTPSRFAARAYVTQTLNDLWPELRNALPDRVRQESVSLEERATEAWSGAISSVLADPHREQQFKLMGESRNEVLEYAPNKFLQGLLVFKRCDVQDGRRLRNERENMRALRARFGRQIAQSLAYVEHEGKAYHILRHGMNRTLEQVVKNGTQEELLNAWTQTASLLAQIHFYRLPGESPAIDGQYFSKRLLEVFYGQFAGSSRITVSHELASELSAVGGRVYRALADAPRGWYKDANWRNWLVEDDQTVVAIDFEHRIKLPVVLDLVSLLESGPANVKHQTLVREHYMGALARTLPVDREEFMQQYRFAGLQRHLEFAGYRARDEEFSAVRFHLEQAQACAHELGEDSLATKLGGITIASEP